MVVPSRPSSTSALGRCRLFMHSRKFFVCEPPEALALGPGSPFLEWTFQPEPSTINAASVPCALARSAPALPNTTSSRSQKVLISAPSLMALSATPRPWLLPPIRANTILSLAPRAEGQRPTQPPAANTVPVVLWNVRRFWVFIECCSIDQTWVLSRQEARVIGHL